MTWSVKLPMFCTIQCIQLLICLHTHNYWLRADKNRLQFRRNLTSPADTWELDNRKQLLKDSWHAICMYYCRLNFWSLTWLGLSFVWILTSWIFSLKHYSSRLLQLLWPVLYPSDITKHRDGACPFNSKRYDYLYVAIRYSSQ